MASKKLQMNSSKDDSDSEEDSESRIRKEFANHNWLIVKLNNRNEGPSNDQKKNCKNGKKKKKVKRPSLRVSIPIEVYHNFKGKRNLNNKSITAKRSSKNDEMQIIPAKEIYIVSDEGPPITNDCQSKVREVIRWAYITVRESDKSRDGHHKCCYLPKTPSDGDHKCFCLPQKQSDGDHKCFCLQKKLSDGDYKYCCLPNKPFDGDHKRCCLPEKPSDGDQKYCLPKKPSDGDHKSYSLPKKLSAVGQSTQTVESRVKDDDIGLQAKEPILAKIQTADQFSQTTMGSVRLYEKERELLNLIEEFGYTSEDLSNFYRTSIKNNNNHKLGNLNDNDKNEINRLNLEIIEIDDDLEINEKKSNETEATATVDGNKNVQKGGSNTEFSALDNLTCTTLDRIRTCSDLNKMVLTTFHNVVDLIKKIHDNTRLDKDISAMANSLVNRIYEVFIEFVENIFKRPRAAVIEILDDSEPPPKRRKESQVQPIEDEDREILNSIPESSRQPTNQDNQRQETVVGEHVPSSQQQSQNHQSSTSDYGNFPTRTNNVTQEQYRETNPYNLYPQVPVNAANLRAGLNFIQRDPRLQNYAPSQPSCSVATQSYQRRANDLPHPTPETRNTYTNNPSHPASETRPNTYEILNQSRASNNLYLQQSRPAQNSTTNNRVSTNDYYRNLYNSNMNIAPAVSRAGTSTTVQKPTHPNSLNDINAQASTSGLSSLLNFRIRSNEYQSSRNHVAVPAAPARPAPYAHSHNPAPPTHPTQPAPQAHGYTTRDYQYPQNAYQRQSNSSGSSSTENNYPSTSAYHHMMSLQRSWHYPYHPRGQNPYQPRQ